MESIVLLRIYVVVLFVFYSHEGCDTVKKRKSIVYTFIKLSRPRAGEGGQY